MCVCPSSQFLCHGQQVVQALLAQLQWPVEGAAELDPADAAFTASAKPNATHRWLFANGVDKSAEEYPDSDEDSDSGDGDAAGGSSEARQQEGSSSSEAGGAPKAGPTPAPTDSTP